MLRVGDWCVNPRSGEITRRRQTIRLDLRSLRLLLCLAEHAGEVVGLDDLMAHVWSGVNVSQDSVYQTVTSLRRVLGDDPKRPSYIETVPRLGYRMIASVSPWREPMATSASGSRKIACLAAILGFIVFIGFGFLVRNRIVDKQQSASASTQPMKAIAVLPFVDLTEGMSQEEFADGMTEELIDKLSKINDLRVPSSTSSFYFRGKQLPVADIAKALGVTYVVDGSVRKSGARVRVAARLVRADNGYVVWSGSYDRAFNDILMIQDDIANRVTKALQTSISAGSHGADPR